MLIIRLQRVGRKNEPKFRAVLTDSKKSAKRGRPIEILGSFDSRPGKDKDNKFNAERIKYWISVGAQLSDTMHNLMVNAKVISGKKINVLPKKTVPAKVEEAPKAEAPKAETV